jgi:O-acetyl-ADP-ribose deacetylase
VLLASAHRRALEVADALGCRTLAVPALSTGVFGYPVEEAARIALTTVRDTLARCTDLEQVTFVLFDRATHDTYRLAALGS